MVKSKAGNNFRTLQRSWLDYKPNVEPSVLHVGAGGRGDETTQEDLFATQMKKSRVEKRDELQIYLDEMVVNSSSELVKYGPLQWWKAHEVVYPNLSKMAKDFLCVSGTGVPIERFFSYGPLLLAPNRRRLSKDTVKKCLCLKGWLKSESQEEFKAFVHASLIEKMSGQ